MAAQSVIVTQRMQPVSKTELLTEVVYGVTTEQHPNSDFTENMHIFTKYTSLVFAHIILYIIHVHTKGGVGISKVVRPLHIKDDS